MTRYNAPATWTFTRFEKGSPVKKHLMTAVVVAAVVAVIFRVPQVRSIVVGS